LPPAISGHQSYFLWGPRGYTGESMIVMDDRQEALESLFSEVRKVARVDHPYSMPYQHSMSSTAAASSSPWMSCGPG
jgi:hypothetical protein